ncbi:hypothetical protein [Mycobacterium sp.]|uniref:hypothetical protein n=1 Tax=Mycobacterium sp. TaxID=1785 RepID=UPI002BB08EB9|nr:hypothetical protein [Mycobacterium sp.]HME47403.1 hypothetical protein [Mycobacterium sp.]
MSSSQPRRGWEPPTPRGKDFKTAPPSMKFAKVFLIFAILFGVFMVVYLTLGLVGVV